MKIQYASDLHLEFGENTKWLKQNPIIPVGDVLVLAGDIGYLNDDNYSKHPFWDWISENFKQAIVIPGNHELYKFYDINDLHEGWTLDIRHNIKAVYNCIVSFGEEIDLIATTLWAKIKPAESHMTERCVSDFHRIRNVQYKLTADRFNEEHESCKRFIEKSVKSSVAKHIIVATHHVPSFALMSEEFRNSSINGAFTAELGDFISDSKIEYWIYGHSHRNIDKTIGKTHCVSNQLGYVFKNEHLSFNPKAIIDIK